jgi:hypothetical protein
LICALTEPDADVLGQKRLILAISKLDLRFTSQANDSGSKAFEGSYSQTFIYRTIQFSKSSPKDQRPSEENPYRKLLPTALHSPMHLPLTIT